MGFSNNTFAKVWEIKENNGYLEGRISISRKNKEGNYVPDFQGFVTFLGEATNKAQFLSGGETIRLLRTDVSNSYNKETQREYVRYKVFDFEIPAPKDPSA